MNESSGRPEAATNTSAGGILCAGGRFLAGLRLVRTDLYGCAADSFQLSIRAQTPMATASKRAIPPTAPTLQCPGTAKSLWSPAPTHFSTVSRHGVALPQPSAQRRRRVGGHSLAGPAGLSAGGASSNRFVRSLHFLHVLHLLPHNNIVAAHSSSTTGKQAAVQMDLRCVTRVSSYRPVHSPRTSTRYCQYPVKPNSTSRLLSSLD